MKRRVPRKCSLVRVVRGVTPERSRAHPLKPGHAYVFLGEIPQTPGHCVIADPTAGRIWAGYHTDNFEEVPRDEA